jgi:PAS domain S-box-containing protein
LRASVDTGWTKKDDWMVFREYEKELDEQIADHQMIILCTYPLNSSPGDQIFDVARVHQMAMARRHGHWEIIETPELKQAKAEIKKLNEQLEQNVQERTRELAAANEALKREIIERQEAELQARILIDAIPQQIWSGPADGTLDYCNDRWRSYTGLKLEELQGEGWQTMLHPKDRERVLKAWQEAAVNGTPYEQEERHRRADGAYRWFLARGVPLRNSEGRIVRWYGTNTDIEDRKRAEEKLKESEAYLAEGQRLSKTGSFGWNVSSGEILWSDETFRIFECDQAIKPTLKLVLERTHPEDTPRVRQLIDRAEVEGADFEIEHRLLTPSGSVKHLHVVAHADKDRSGNLEFVGAVMDITERKRMEEALRESELRLREILELLPAAVYVVDMNGLIQRYNPMAAELWGRHPRLGDPAERYCGSLRLFKPDGTLVPHEESLMAAILRTGAPVRNQEVIMERPDGSRVIVMVNLTPLRNPKGEQVGAINCFLDVSDRRRAEEALRQTQARLIRVARSTTAGELTASIAHEVNQPLGAIVTNADACLHWLAGKAPDLKEAREALERIIREGNRASAVIARIRSLLTTGKLTKTEFALDELIGEIVALTELEAHQGRVSMRTRLAPNLPRITADRVQLQQVLLNLVINSFDALNEATGRPHQIIIESRMEPPGAITVTVQDTGIGIDPQRLQEVFEPFHTTKPEGLGLGLSISRSIVEAHGGHLQARANDGPGVQFSFTLPIRGEASREGNPVAWGNDIR